MQGDFSEIDLQDTGDEARSCLSWILSGMGIEAEIELFFRDEQIVLNVLCGNDSSIAIGRRGQTLEALQTLVKRITARRFPETVIPAKILIDVEGYRDRRRSNLVDMARRAVEEVRETGEPTFLEPLNSYERFIVHTTLKEEQGITTSSRGEGAMKQILVSPADEIDP